ncbi:cupin-like domain-containing protein [Brevundimonas albigilva]|uniref:Cupin-like domain-containing protein n=1 Tax=Brevundimonas albigilva TaxID=1312364 RepID=A0ABY4SSI2_9CAUL|nr:cupin-like domain-containing protein [Brevundimonas albigilva]URI15625.1 cupin-like domain-containing protein [Brevundimonas albigilva]
MTPGFPTPETACPVLTQVGRAQFFDEIVPAGRPVVMRGLVGDWPAVRAARQSPQALVDHLGAFDQGRPVRVIVTDPSEDGRFFYDDALTRLNFRKHEGTVSQVLARLLAPSDGSAFAAQAVTAPDILPGFSAANPSPLVDDDVPARLWISTQAVVQTHYDLYDNIACAVSGRRRFILFPPEQAPNLYLGPLEHTPAGAPVSMVRLDAPDLERFPRFPTAWAAAQAADLAPGDALFIPFMWWHHVQSLDRVSVLANFWWNATPDRGAMAAVIHAIAAVRDLPARQRRAWAGLFEALVFDAETPPGRHLPPERRGVQGPLDAAAQQRLRDTLIRTLSQA